jgi:prephenate dehydrogenase
MRTALIAGLGLIGGAIGMSLRRTGWRVQYLDPNIDEDDAVRAGAADARVPAFGDADITILATPVDVAVGLIGQAKGLVTSVCSVMRPLREVAGEHFVAGHPMAGHHESGLAHARHVTLAGAPWFLDRKNGVVDEVVRDCGAEAVYVDAAEHDASVALTSHLPQVLSTALYAHLSDRPELMRFAGGGLKSFRLAASDGAMWEPVLEANRDNLRPHAEAIANIVRAIIEGDDRDAFEKARALWRSLQR